MDGMEEKLNSILGNPELMAQISSMAQSLGKQSDTSTKEPAVNQPILDLDPAMLRNIGAILQGSGIDSNQQALLRALKPYLTAERIIKLEKAMRAAKLAGIATTFLGKSGLSFLTGG